MLDQRYLTILNDVRLQFKDLIILILIYEEQNEYLRLAHEHDFLGFAQSIRHLESESLVKWHSDDPTEIILRKVGEDLFKKHVGTKKKVYTKKEVEIWIDAWRDIFPPGSNSGGYRYRGDRAGCIQKMIKFVNDNSYTVEQIFEATKDYVERFSQKGFAYMQLAHFFIHKQGVGSTLAAECEGLSEKSNAKEEGDSYGREVV